MWVVMLNLVGGPSLSVTVIVLTSNLCGLFGQSALVAAAGAKKGLFVNLKKLKRIRSAPDIADAQAVDARNLARLIAAGK